MKKFEDMFFEHRRQGNFRNNIINELKLIANSLIHTSVGLTLDSTIFEYLKFINLDSMSENLSTYNTARSFHHTSALKLNQEPSEIFMANNPYKTYVDKKPYDKFTDKNSFVIFGSNQSLEEPDRNFSHLSPSAISLIQKSENTFMAEEVEEGEEEEVAWEDEEGTPTSMSRLSSKILGTGSKAWTEIQSILEKTSSLRLLSSPKGQLFSPIKSKSSNWIPHQLVNDTITRSEPPVSPDIYDKPNEEFPPNGKERKLMRRKVQTLWGIAKINEFDDNASVVEIYGTTTQKPSINCDKLLGILVTGPRKI